MATTSTLMKITAITFVVLFCVRVTYAQLDPSLTCFVNAASNDLRTAKGVELIAVRGMVDDADTRMTFSSRDYPEIYTDGNIVEYGEITSVTGNTASLAIQIELATFSQPEEEDLKGARFGVHFCDLFAPGTRIRIPLLIYNQNTLIPKDGIRTHIVSVGETLELCLAPMPKIWKGPIEWVFNDKQPSWLKRWTGFTCIRIKDIETSQSGIYEAYRRICGRRTNQHAFFEVKVRQCPNGFRSPPYCEQTCTETCVNGGYCSDVEDLCICPNGFSGATCSDVSEGNFEATTEISFADVSLESTGKGALMCTARAGCTCTPGWKGIKCDQECDVNTYGPDCALSCSGGCNRFTGT